MNHLSIVDLPLGRDQSIVVSFHRKSGNWWAVLYEGEKARFGSEDTTAIAALAELLVEIGAGKAEGAQ